MPFRPLIDSLKGARRRSGFANARRPVAAATLEPLEDRRALAVAAPSIRLMTASDTGVKGDGITRVARPVFVGNAPPRAFVEVFTQSGTPLGVARANLKGVWSLATPAARPMAAGDHVLRATTVDTVRNERSSPKEFWFRIDPTPPVAMELTYAHDPATGVGVATLSFSKPVMGVTRGSLRLVGTTSEGIAVNVALSDPAIRPYVGVVSLARSQDGLTYTFREGIALAESGAFRLVLVAKGSGIADHAGNPLSKGIQSRLITP